jgi:hypothetical protein
LIKSRCDTGTSSPKLVVPEMKHYYDSIISTAPNRVNT